MRRLSVPLSILLLVGVLLGTVFVDPAAAGAKPTWTAATLPGFPPDGGRGHVVTCASTTFCLALDAAGDAWVFTGSTWSGPTATGIGDPSVAPGNAVVGVSCSSPSFCLAIDTSGHYVTLTGRGWSSPAQVPAPATVSGVSCPSPSFCFASSGDGHSGFIFNNEALTVYGAPPQPSSVSGLAMQAVSCRNVTFCMVVGSGYAEAFNGGDNTWATPTTFNPPTDLTSVDCVTKISCVSGAAGPTDVVWTYNGASWSESSLTTGSASTDVVSCPTPKFCMAADSSGDVFTRVNGVWSTGQSADPVDPGEPIADLSCASKLFCVALDDAPGGGGGANHVLTYAKA
jgi:hypothetical protein